MDINSIKGALAYAATSVTTPQTDQAQSRNQNNDPLNSAQSKENVSPSQKAYELNITEEAREKSRLETKPRDTQMTGETSEPMETQEAQSVSKAYETSQIVNIVA